MEINRMRDIKSVDLPKYTGGDYEHIGFRVYRNKAAKNYCLTLTADEMNEFIMERLLEQYSLNCTKHCGEQTEIDGKTVCIAEFETGDDTLKDLQKILCLASAVGKEIADIDFDLGDVLSVRTGDVTFPVKGGEMTLPVYSVREDIYNGMLSFTNRYPDIPFTNNMAKCIGSVEIPGDCDYKAVLIQGFRAYLLLEYKGQIIAFVYGFDEKKYLGMVKGRQMLSGIRGYER